MALTTMITAPRIASSYSEQLFPIAIVVYIGNSDISLIVAILKNGKFSVLVAPKVLINLKSCIEVYKKHHYFDNQTLQEVLRLSVVDLIGVLKDS